MDSGQKSLLLIPEWQGPSFDSYLIAILIQLPDDDDTCSKPGNVVHIGECMVFPILALIEDNAHTFNEHHKANGELHHAHCPAIDVGERHPRP
jgi:hypothetical protein